MSIFRHIKFTWFFYIVFLILLPTSIWMLARALQAEVQKTSESSNVTLTRAFVNNNWDAISPLLILGQDAVSVKANPSIPVIESKVRTFSNGTDLVKVKVYDLKGLTVYSSDPAQIGEDKSNNEGFVQATKGQVVSELTYRGKFGGFDGDLYHRNLVSSYVPIYSPQGVQAVVEVYTDRTDSIERVERRVIEVSVSLAALLGGVLSALYILVRQQKVILKSQDKDASNKIINDSEVESSKVCNGLVRQIEESLLRRSQTLQVLMTDLMATSLDSSQMSLVRSLSSLSSAEATQARYLSWLLELIEGHQVSMSTSFDLNAMIAEIFQQHANAASENGVVVQKHIAIDLPKSFVGDPQITARLLDLLLQIICSRAISSILQFKAQMGLGGLQVDLVSSRARESNIGILEKCLIEKMVRYLDADFRIQTSTESGDWFALTLPLKKSVVQ